MPHYDLTEKDEGTAFDTPLSDKDGPIALVATTDSVIFRFWFDGDENPAREGAATIEQDDPAIVRYVGQFNDINNGGLLWGQWKLDIVSKGTKKATFPIRYDVAPLIGP